MLQVWVFGVLLLESKSAFFYFRCKGFVPLALGYLADLAHLYVYVSCLGFTSPGNKGWGFFCIKCHFLWVLADM